MEANFTDAEISSFIKDVIELGGGNTVDDSPDKYIRLASSGKQETLTVDGRAVPLAIYGTRATDVIIINPFAEGEADSSKNLWFYSSRNIILAAIIIKIMRHLLALGAENTSKKKPEKDKDAAVDMKAIGLLSKHILNVDEKMVKEFESISKEFHNFFNIYYNKTSRQGEVKCLVFNEAQRKAFPSVRVKSWDVFSGLLLDILNVSDLSEFNYVPQTQGIPVFESFSNILVSVYEHIAEAAKVINREITNIGTLRSHLKYLPQYYGKARWCTSAQPQALNPMGMPSPLPQMNMVPMQPLVPGVMGAGIPNAMPMMYNTGMAQLGVPGITVTGGPMMPPVMPSPTFGGVPMVPVQQPYGYQQNQQSQPQQAVNNSLSSGSRNPFQRA